MCGFIAQLVEHRTGIAEVTGSNPVEALIFFRLLHSSCLNWKFTAKITYHLHIYPQFIYESFHILHVEMECVRKPSAKAFKSRKHGKGEKRRQCKAWLKRKCEANHKPNQKPHAEDAPHKDFQAPEIVVTKPKDSTK